MTTQTMTDYEKQSALYWLEIIEAYQTGWTRGLKWGLLDAEEDCRQEIAKAFTDGWDKGFRSRAGF